MSLIEDFNTAYNESSTKWSPWWKEAKRDTEYYLGKQWSKKDRAYLEAQDRDPEVYNRVKLIVSRISGYQRKNRLSMRVEATAGSDQTAAILSGIVQYEMNKPGVGSGYMLMSNAFKWGALCSGLNDIEVYMDYSMDPVCGDIRFRRRPYNSMLRDPYFTELDLSDCRYILDRIWVTKDEAKAILPGHRNTITAMLPKGPDGKFPHAAKEKDFRGKPLLKLDRFYRQEFKKTYSLVNQMTGQVSEWEGNKADLDRQLSQPAQVQGVNLGVNWGQILQPMAGQKRIIKLAYLLDDKEMYDDEDPLGLDDYPFVPVMGYWAPEYDEMKWKLQGMPMPWSKILEYSGLEIEPELVQQIKQQEQIQMKLTMGKVEAEMMRVKLQAALDQAKASAIQVKSGLDRAKTMEIIKKLESMDTAQMMKMIELSMKIEKEGHFGVDPLPQPESNVIPMKRNEQMMTTR